MTLDVYFTPETCNAFDPMRITDLGCNLLELLMETAYGDYQLHREEALDKFSHCFIKQIESGVLNFH